jgi:hypothetical protein
VVDSAVVTSEEHDRRRRAAARAAKVSGFYTVRIMPFASAKRTANKPRASMLYVGTDEAESALDAARQAAERYAGPKEWSRILVRRRNKRSMVFELYRFLTKYEKPLSNANRLQREHVANIVVEKR